MLTSAIEAVALLPRAAEPDLLPSWAQAAAAGMSVDVLCDLVVRADIAAAFTDHAADQSFVARLRASVEENVRTLQQLLCARTTLAEVRLDRPLEFGAVQARLCIPQTALQRSYRVGFFTMWTEWSDQVARHATAAEVPNEQTLAALACLSRLIFGYQDHVASAVAESHAQIERAISRSRTHERQRLVRALLADDTPTIAPADRVAIGYEFDAHHLAVLLSDAEENPAARRLGAAFATIGAQRLEQPLSLSSSVHWLSRTRAWTPGSIDEVSTALAEIGLTASIGEPGQGLQGFRQAYRSAIDVERIRVARGGVAPMVLRECDVRLELLLSGNPDAPRFVSQELGPLALDTAEAARLRQTLEASYRCGSHVAAAEELRLHEHTVRNRLRRIAELLGREPHQRTAETQLALRLYRLVGSDGAQRPAIRANTANTLAVSSSA